MSTKERKGPYQTPIDYKIHENIHLTDKQILAKYKKRTRQKHLRIMNLYDSQDGYCDACGHLTWLKIRGQKGPQQLEATIEHVQPKAYGGSTLLRANQVMTCHHCNEKRATMYYPLYKIAVRLGLVSQAKSYSRKYFKARVWLKDCVRTIGTTASFVG